MFKRRHPYLFFVLVLAAIISISSVLSGLVGLFVERREMRKGEQVGVIEVNGMIVESKKIIGQLRDFRENDHIKAIVLRIDSPGGAVGPSQEIYAEVKRTVKKKPVVASMGAIAASGGYYVAASADGIVANPGTITGSIGVLMQLTDFRDLFEKIGIQSDVVKSGEYKDLGSPFRSISETEEGLLQQFVDAVHRQFVSDVAEGRNLDEETVGGLANGMIFTGEFALEAGLIDRMGNFNDAVEWAGRKGGIDGDIVTVYPPEKRLSIVRRILQMTAAEIEAVLYRIGSSSIRGGYLYEPSAGQSLPR